MGWYQDARYAIRLLWQRPGFTLAAAITLGLGIGANLALFTLTYDVLLKPLGYPEPERVVEVWNRWDGELHHLAVPEYRAYRDDSDSFEALAAFGTGSVNLTGSSDPERVAAVYASSDIFQVLGTPPRLGRAFAPEEDLPGRDDVVVLSYEIWQRRFGGDRSIVGRELILDGETHTVVGVMPPGTRLPDDYRTGALTDLWMPLALDPADPGDWGMHFLRSIGRLRSEASLTSAQTDLDRVVALMRQGVGSEDAAGIAGFSASVVAVRERIVGPVRSALMMLLGAVGFVLLIACANVANLLLMRSESRRREMTLRFALGAARWRLIRQGLTEAVALSVVGGLVGLALGAWALTAFIRLSPPSLPRLWDVQLDMRMLGLSFLLSVVTGIVLGLLPAWRAARLASVRQGDLRGGEPPQRLRLRSLLVVSELALAVVVVMSAGLLLKSLWKLQHVDPGYVTERVLTVQLALPESSYGDAARIAGFFTELSARLDSHPEIEASGGVTHLPLASPRGDWNFYPEDRTIEPGQPKPRGDWQAVTPGYFRAMGVPILRGRDLELTDGSDTRLVLLVNQSLAEKYWPGQNPVGQRIRLGGNDNNPMATIVGVIANIRHQQLSAEPLPEIYLPQAQASTIMGRGEFRNVFYTVRTRRDPERVAETLRTVVSDLDSDVPLGDLRTMEDVRSTSLAIPRFTTTLIAAFGSVALVLGAVGIFALLSYIVAQRTREVGIRLAIGAAPAHVMRQVVGRGMVLTGAGIAIGLAGSFLVSRTLANLLYDVAPHDPWTYVLVTATLAAVALGAAYVPARRAAGVDPVRALRSE